MFRRSRLFIRENGGYVFFWSLIDRPVSWLRDRMLANKFGVQHLHIGPRAFLRGLSLIDMGEDFSAQEGLWLEAITQHGGKRFTPRIVIGEHVRISRWTHIACIHSVIIGDHVLIGSKVMITDHNHGIFTGRATSPHIPPAERQVDADRSVKIGPKVWLGDGVVVCPGVTMGEGSVAGANAVVTTDVSPFTLVAGVPARPIRRYDPVTECWVRL